MELSTVPVLSRTLHPERRRVACQNLAEPNMPWQNFRTATLFFLMWLPSPPSPTPRIMSLLEMCGAVVQERWQTLLLHVPSCFFGKVGFSNVEMCQDNNQTTFWITCMATISKLQLTEWVDRRKSSWNFGTYWFVPVYYNVNSLFLK